MPYLLKVVCPDGVVKTLTLSAVSQANAFDLAERMGLRVMGVEALPAAPVPRTRSFQFPLLLFSQELLALLEAGLNLVEALTTLHAKERHVGVRGVLHECLTSLHEGKNLSDVLAAQPRHFPEIYIATVRASERSGDLPQALERYCAYAQQFEAFRKKLVTAAIYPGVLVAVGLLVVIFLMGYVVPRFSSVYASSGHDVPWASALLLGMGQWIYAYRFSIVPLVGLGSFASGVYLFSAPGRRWALSRILALPLIAQKAEEFQLARFYRAVGLLLVSGIALPRAMSMTMGLLGAKQRVRLETARRLIESGGSFSAAMVDTGLASPVAESLIRVGERSGQMGSMLERVARFQDDDLARWVDVASRLLEPALMILIGLLIGGVVVLMYLPIFELAGSL